MTGDYYTLLGITKDADKEEVAKAYRKMALMFHPDLNKEGNSATQFQQVSEAYDVLSNPLLRALYDDFGDDGLKQDYKFSGDPDAIFKSFFGVANPFQVKDRDAETTKHHFFSETAGAAKQAKCPTKQVVVECTLEELFLGTSRTLEMKVEMMDREGRTYKTGVNTLRVDIERGTKSNAELTFLNKGNEQDGAQTGDVVVVVKQLPHKHFKRDGDNLIYTKKITLRDALVGFSVEVDTLDNRRLSVFIDEVVHPTYRKVLQGEGLPRFRKDGQRGDLVLLFETEFPKYLTDGQKKEITRVFSSSSSS